MMSEHNQTRINNAERSKERYGYQQDNRRNNTERQKQANKQYLFKQEKCTLKQKTTYYKIFLTIYFEGLEGHIIYQWRDQKKQSYKVNCSSIVKISQDSKRFKVILALDQQINWFGNEKSDYLDINFANEEKSLKCKSFLEQKCNIKQRAISNIQYSKSEKMAQHIPLFKKQIIRQQQRTIKSNRTISSLQKDQKLAIQKTKGISPTQYQELQQKLKSTEDQLSKTTRELQIHREETKRMRQSQAGINNKDQIIRQLQIKVENLEKQMNMKEKKHKQQMEQIQNRVAQLLKKIRQAGQVLRNEKQKNMRLETNLHQKQLEIQKYKTLTQKSNDGELTKLRLKHQTEIADLEIKFQKRYEEQIKKTKFSTQNLEKQKYKQIQSNYQQIQNKYQRLQQKYNLLQKQYNQMKYLHIFEGPVLQNYLEYKTFLKEAIQKYTRRKILKTNLIYKFEKKSNINFHHYIDGNQNIVVIAKTTSAMFFAAFSQSCIRPKQIAIKGGMILSLTNSRVFELIKNMRSVSYDDYYIIFGNSEIRLKWQECKVFSNFGTSNGYYNAQGESINTLLGQVILRQTFLENYEFHQVIFQD